MNTTRDLVLRFIKGFLIPTLVLKRKVHFPGKRGRETLAEHLVQLLYFAEFFVNKYVPPYDLARVREYILAHDMSEPATVHAKRNGFDICRFNASSELIRRKKELERQALSLQRRQFPELEALATMSDRYEEREDAESRFVKAIDALVPMLNTIIDHGRTNHIDRITLKMWRADREWRIKLDPYVFGYYKKEVLPLLIAREEELFSEPPQGEFKLE